MSASTAQDGFATISEGIALLIELAEKGEINPWDVQVIEVIDRCLSKLAPACEPRTDADFADLSQSGQAFLYASMLVLLKAESLVLSASPPELSEDAQLVESEELAGGRKLPQNLEKQLRRRAVAQLPRKRAVTLQELIEQLQLMQAAIEETPSPPRVRRTSSKVREQAARAIAELAHQENLVETATELERFLAEHGPNVGGDWLDIEQLLNLWQQEHLHSGAASEFMVTNGDSHSSQSDRVGIFWALLLLSAQSKVELLQDEFYQDLKIRPL
ncbi:condensin subunit ScpA [Oscillatoriales cyanobacterium USR001]|nr:condensin subunit ScpA [Oscillatoriales cyanobacterium USR001]